MKTLLNGNRLAAGVALALIVLSDGWARADERRPDCYVLSAGVDNYLRAGKLRGCLNDARNTTAVFQSQQGKMFRHVYAHTLLDSQATHARILEKLRSYARVGQPGDCVVLFLSGHGSRTANQQSWYFVPYDYDPQRHAATALTDRQILDAAHELAARGKKVIVIVDACFAGQLNVTARSYFAKYRNPQGGGLVLMLSSGANQTSMALGQYSAFAKAFADSMTPKADSNNDGKISLEEIRRYSHARTHQLVREHGLNATQDSEVAWSPSISSNMPLAMVHRSSSTNPPPIVDNRPVPRPMPTPAPATSSSTWVGSETLPGFGRLAFRLEDGGRAVMTDAAGASEGSWQRQGARVTLRFSNGRVVYTGTLRDSLLTGTAYNGTTSWTFSVYSTANSSARMR